MNSPKTSPPKATNIASAAPRRCWPPTTRTSRSARFDYPIQAIRLGDFTILALGGEVVVDYALRTKREFPGQDMMVIGYANEVMSYIPTKRILGEGGYEPDTSQIYYGNPGPYADTVEEKIMTAIHETLGKLGVR